MKYTTNTELEEFISPMVEWWFKIMLLKSDIALLGFIAGERNLSLKVEMGKRIIYCTVLNFTVYKSKNCDAL